MRIVILVLEVLWSGVPAQEDGQEGDAGGGEPGQDDHDDGRLDSDEGMVDQWPGYGIISRTNFATESNEMRSVI